MKEIFLAHPYLSTFIIAIALVVIGRIIECIIVVWSDD
jgi:hypothetical protein